MQTKEVRVTPDLARKWLSLNTQSNRNISRTTVEAYAKEMVAGRWHLTHQGLAFNQTGELVDGQHRLHAVIVSGVDVLMLVTTGLSVEYNSPIDQGYNRSIGQLTGRGTRWVSIVRALMGMEMGLKDMSFKSTVGSIETCAERHEASLLAVMEAAKSPRACPTGFVAAMAYAHPTGPDKVISFAHQVNTGELLEHGDPALSLRRWIAQGRKSPRETVIASLAALRAVYQGRKLTKITAGVTGSERDGSSGYAWFTYKRRGMKLYEGTPSMEMVP